MKTSIINVKYDYICNEQYLKVNASHIVTENDYFVNVTFDVQKPYTSVKVLISRSMVSISLIIIKDILRFIQNSTLKKINSMKIMNIM